ncbi:TonB-dependent receptor [Aureibaculum algae]|uniref:TonB-dependent receptor n=1 Tax=Aureibaculum algae TaxID=2584122 RepID=A0A5B7TSZ2_9FLAO|nr:TonB-dependent receptor [Aureibaculum algae]QCX39480.1 TonB-dependent receptor [Aureibaculum algae]
MKKIILIVFILSIHTTIAQKSTEKITISYGNNSIIDVLKKIEKKTSYRFYFIENWFNDNYRISGQYDSAKLSVVLKDIFEQTSINYYITSDNKVILTQNNIIHDFFPKIGLSENGDENKAIEGKKPVFIARGNTPRRKGIETIRIGKETIYSSLKEFTLKGRVIHTETKEPIPNLVISVPDKNINSVTDFDGNYTINLPLGTNYLELKSLGMLDLKVKAIIYNDGFYNFRMEDNLEMLDEIIIDADKDKNVNESIAGITKIQIKDVKTIPLVLGERDILKVATTLPGISTAGEAAAGYNVRGGKTDQNLMLLDNAVIYNPTHFFGIFSALNPFTTGDLEIYKGNIPAEFGGRLSSVFDITTKKGNNNEFKGEGSIGPVTGNLTFEIPIIKEKSSLIVGARATYSDWLLNATNEEKLENSKASFYDAIIKYTHEFNENNSLLATAYFSNDKYSIASDSLYGYSNTLLSLNWNHRFNEKNKGSLILAHSSYDFNIDYDNKNGNSNFNFAYDVNETELKLLMSYVPNNKHSIDYGISGKFYSNSPGKKTPKGNNSIVNTLTINKEQALESALFITDDFSISENLAINAGLRYSYYAFLGNTDQIVYAQNSPRNEETAIDTLNFGKNEVVKNYGGPELRLSARYSVSPSLSIKASYNNNFQFIHTLSNNTTASPSDTWKLSDYNIKPQRAQQVSLGLYKNIDGNTYELSIESYYKKLKNTLDYKVGAELLFNNTIETEILQGDGKAYGLEFLVKKNKGRLNGWIGYTYSKSLVKLDSKFSENRVNNGKYFNSNYDKPHDLSIVANYKLTKRYSFSANFLFQTGRPVTYPIGKYEFEGEQYVFYSERNKFRIPNYYRLDLGINIEGNHKIKKFAHSFWNISVYNVLGRNNPLSVFFVTEDGGIKAYKSSVFSVPVPTITYNFKF